MIERSIGLVLDSRQWRNRFGRYVGEILAAEGIGDYETLELDRELTAAALRRYGVVVLTNCGATPELEALLAEYVQDGGQLVALRPDLALAKLMGLQPMWRVARGAAVLLRSTLGGAAPTGAGSDVDLGPCAGFPYEPLQVVGSLDLYQAAEGTRALARVVTGAWGLEPYPALVTRALGAGRVAAFCYDLPHTVARLRQGDPELAEVDSDGLDGVRPGDAMLDQIDVRAALIPQAEVHQALLARTIEWLAPWPLPRLWYLPDEAKAMLLLSGDGCGDPPSAVYEDEAALLEQAGGALTYYLIKDTQLTPEVAAGLRRRGHELSIHPFAQPFSAPSMAAALATHVQSFTERFGASPRTVRHHRLQWIGWAEQAKIEADAGLRMDLNFVTTRPVRNGYLFGAGRPLRFVDERGQVVDAWQQPTHYEDDVVMGSHEISLRIDTDEAIALYDALLDEAVSRWHTVLAVNLHPGNFIRYSGDWGRHAVTYTARKGVPMWSSERWLDFTAERASLRVERPAATDRGWRIRVDRSTGSRELLLLVPEEFDGRRLAEPAQGPQIELYGRRYRGLALKGAPLSADLVYTSEQ